MYVGLTTVQSMTKTETFQVRLAPDELDRLRDYSESRGWTMAQAIRDLVRRLPGRGPRSIAITGDVELMDRPVHGVQGCLIGAMTNPGDQPQNGQPRPNGLTGVDTVSRLPAYRVGAGTSGNEGTESVSSLPSGNCQPEKAVSLKVVEVGCSSKVSSKTHTLGEGVGKGSGGTPRKPLKLDTNWEGIEFPEWLEPYRNHLTMWLKNRKKEHKMEPSFSPLTIKALRYAQETGVLREYCELVSEKNWQSLGFAGYKDTINKVAKDNGITVRNGGRSEKPPMSPIKYTLG